MDSAVLILVALGSGLGGALVTTMLRISHERQEQIRDRQLTAADEFGTGILRVILSLRDAEGAVQKHGFLDKKDEWEFHTRSRDPESDERPAAIESAYEETHRVMDEAYARFPRIQLLFGVGTRAEKAARSCVVFSGLSMDSLETSSGPNYDVYRKAFKSLNESHEKFAIRAAEAIQGERWHHRLARKLRRAEPPAETPEPDSV